MGEGAGMLVIESLEHARGASPGRTHWIWHQRRCVSHYLRPRRRQRRATLDADGADAGRPDSVRPAASQRSRDLHAGRRHGRMAAVRDLFGVDVPLAITATKSATGHLLGAAGGVAAIFTARLARSGRPDDAEPRTAGCTRRGHGHRA